MIPEDVLQSSLFEMRKMKQRTDRALAQVGQEDLFRKIDPGTNRVVKQWLGMGGDSVRAAHGSVWISNLRQGNVWRIDAKQN